MEQKVFPGPVLENRKFDNSKFIEYTAYLRQKYTLNDEILFIQAPQFLFESFNKEIVKNKGYYAYPPTGLQCLANALEGRDLKIEILDLNYQVLKRVIEEDKFDYRNWLGILGEYLESHNPSIIGVTSINIYTDVFKPGYPLTSILEYLKGKDKYIVLAGGPIAANEQGNYLDKDLCHFVVKGEGENKIRFIFDWFFSGASKENPMRGIYFKLNNELEETCGRQDTVELNGNLVNTYDLVPIEDYHNIGSLNPYSRMAGLEKRFSVFQLNRGCRANCRFCGVTDFMGRGVRRFPVDDLLTEIKYLVEERGVRHFDVLDDDFLVDRQAVAELLISLAELRKRHGITWSSNNGLIATSITEELMALMADSGCVGFRIGVESGSPEMLKKLRKPANIPLLKKVAGILNRFPGVFTGANFIIGLLTQESFEDMLATFKFCSELNLDWASFAVFQFTHKSMAGEFKCLRPQATDFVPSKSHLKREISLDEKIISGPEVFDIPLDSVPSLEQVNQIWFTFNLAANYINNKNLKKGGRPEKFTSWVEAVKISYPHNPYMSLFAGLGRILQGDKVRALEHLEETKAILKESQYWQYRFTQFDFNGLVDNFPQEPDGIYEGLARLRKRYRKWTNAD